MNYRLSASETVSFGVRRIAREEIQGAIACLREGDSDPHARIHDARKHLKQFRALVRLIRADAAKTFKSEDRIVRDLGRGLSDARDAQVILGAFEAIAGSLSASEDVRREIHMLLTKERDEAEVPGAGDPGERLVELAAQLEEALLRVDLWPVGNRYGTIEKGLARSYTDARRSLDRARAERSAERFHELRKRTKDLWYQARLLEEPWRGVLDSYRDSLKELSDVVGRHHDLEILGERAGRLPEALDAAPLLRRIEEGQEALEWEALALGVKLYAEKPGPFRLRTRRYWLLWRLEGSEVSIRSGAGSPD